MTSLALLIAVIIALANLSKALRSTSTFIRMPWITLPAAIPGDKDYLLVLVVLGMLFFFAVYSLNDKWSQEILGGQGFCPDVAVESLSLCAPSVYFRRIPWVIAEMEEHLGWQQGFSGGERLKGYLRERAGTRRDPWFMEQAKRYKQQMSFVKSQSCLFDFSFFFFFDAVCDLSTHNSIRIAG